MTTGQLRDPFDRQINYLRLSVTDRCNLRCVYCMAEQMTFLPRKQILSLEEMATISAAFVSLGVSKIRLTGGEPLIRNNVLWLARELAELDGLRELTLTTNGINLARYAKPLAVLGMRRINISIDSLKPERFAAISRVGELTTVLEGIRAAQAAEFDRIKLNVVVMRGINDDEVLDLAHFAVDNGMDISFIEEMPLGVIDSHQRRDTAYSNQTLRQQLEAEFELVDSAVSTGGPSRYMQVAGGERRIGLISPMTDNFCASCNRVRLTAEGQLLLCLGNEHALDLRAIVRRYPGELAPLQEAITEAIARKPERHHFESERTDIVRFMNMTGG